MTEQTPGELIYEYTIQSTGATSYGVPRAERSAVRCRRHPHTRGPVRPRVPGADRPPEGYENG
jgi:hypothetical protein